MQRGARNVPRCFLVGFLICRYRRAGSDQRIQTWHWWNADGANTHIAGSLEVTLNDPKGPLFRSTVRSRKARCRDDLFYSGLRAAAVRKYTLGYSIVRSVLPILVGSALSLAQAIRPIIGKGESQFAKPYYLVPKGPSTLGRKPAYPPIRLAANTTYHRPQLSPILADFF
jgi:hypothetical protein